MVAKQPVPGRVKTRLCPPCSPDQAAGLAAAALADTFAAVATAPAARRVAVLDGAPGDWLPAGLEVWPQATGGLDERIAAAFERAAATDPDSAVLLVGMDTPQLTARLLDVDADRDAWFGPAPDGGFWALGLARPAAELVRGVPMSRGDTGALQLARLRAAGLDVGMLPPLRDVDTVTDAAEVARTAPGTAFATAWREVSAAWPEVAAGGVSGAGPAGSRSAGSAGSVR